MAVTVRDLTREFDDISHRTVLYAARQKGWIEQKLLVDWSQWTFDAGRADQLRAVLYAHLNGCTEVLQLLYRQLRQSGGRFTAVEDLGSQLTCPSDEFEERLDTLARKGLIAYMEEEADLDVHRVALAEMARWHLENQELEKLYDSSLNWQPPSARPGPSVDT